MIQIKRKQSERKLQDPKTAVTVWLLILLFGSLDGDGGQKVTRACGKKARQCSAAILHDGEENIVFLSFSFYTNK
jgi:hypothetical protein